VGTSKPEHVAAAVIRAIERNRAEIMVAPLAMRVGAELAGAAPQTAAMVSRRMGSHELAAQFDESQRDKR